MSLKQKMLNPLLGSSYSGKVLTTAPDNLVGFWPQNEGAGAVSYDKGPHGHDGAYTGVTLGQPGIGDGNTCPLFDGINDYNDIHSAGLANDNLLSNPGFETAGGGDPDFWANWSESVGDGALANETSLQHTGADAAKLTYGDPGTSRIFQSVTVSAGKKYRLRFFTRGDGSVAGQYRLQDVSNTADILAITTTGVTGTDYTLVSYEFTSPSGCTEVRINYYGPTSAGSAYFDTTEVRAVDGFDGYEGTLLAWAKVSAAGVWEDSTARLIAGLYVDANNLIGFGRTTGNNVITFDYKANGTAETQATGSLSNIDFACYVIKWSQANDSVDYYIAGVASGSADTGLGVWLGDLASTATIIGATNDTPDNPWSGTIGPAVLWNTPLTADQIAHLSKV